MDDISGILTTVVQDMKKREKTAIANPNLNRSGIFTTPPCGCPDLPKTFLPKKYEYSVTGVTDISCDLQHNLTKTALSTADTSYDGKRRRNMEALLETPIFVPISQIILALVFSTVALLFGRVRLALLVAYCFVFYWSKPWSFRLVTETTPARLNGPEFLFVAFCFLTLLLSFMALAFHRD
jgi:hypothetical protein